MSCFLCFKIKFNLCFAKIISGINTFLTIFDPVKERKASVSDSPELSKTYFVFPLSLFLLNHLDILFQLLFSPFPYSSNPDLIFHKILPLGFWEHGDVVVILGMVMAAIDFAILLWTPLIDEHFEMQAHVEKDSQKRMHLQRMTMNGQQLSTQLGEKIFYTHKKATRLIRVFWMTTTAEIYILFIWQLVVKFSGTVRDFLQMINVPVLFLFGGWSNVVLICYFILTVKYILTKQEYQIQELEKRNRQLLQAAGNQPTHAKYHYISHRFAKTQKAISFLFLEISTYNNFWSRIVSNYFLIYIIQIVYLAYSFFLVTTNIEFLQRQFFIFFAINFIATLTYVTFQCNLVVQNNMTIFKRSRQFYYTLSENWNSPYLNRLQIDSFEASQKSYSQLNGFKLVNNYRINSQMFELLFSHISTLFMMTIRQKYSQW